MKLIGILTVLISFTAFSQNAVNEITFPTGFLGNLQSSGSNYLFFKEIGPNTIYLDYPLNKSGKSTDEIRRVFIDKTSFNIIKDSLLYDATNPFYYNDTSFGSYFRSHSIYLTDDKDKNNYNLNHYTDSNLVLHIEFYSTSTNFINDSLLFKSYDSISPIVKSDPFLYDSILYIYSSNFIGDTFYLKSYDFNGNLLNENEFFSDSNGISNEFSFFHLHRGPVAVFPPNDSLLIMQSPLTAQFMRINRFTLDTAGVVGPKDSAINYLFGNYFWAGYNTNEYRFFPNHYTIGANLSHYPFLNLSNFYEDFNYFTMDLDYDGNLLGYKDYGHDSIRNKSDNFEIIDDITFIVGSQPHSALFDYAQEYRQLLIYKDSANVVDSLFLYGNKNHKAVELIVDSITKDLFILSRFSNAWTDDSVYFQVTKVSNSIITSAKEVNPKQSSLVVYPNPTENWLNSDQFRYGTGYRIYNLKGQLIEERQIDASKQIDVAHLPQGNYILLLLEDGVPKARSFHFVKQ